MKRRRGKRGGFVTPVNVRKCVSIFQLAFYLLYSKIQLIANSSSLLCVQCHFTYRYDDYL